MRGLNPVIFGLDEIYEAIFFFLLISVFLLFLFSHFENTRSRAWAGPSSTRATRAPSAALREMV